MYAAYLDRYFGYFEIISNNWITFSPILKIKSLKSHGTGSAGTRFHRPRQSVDEVEKSIKSNTYSGLETEYYIVFFSAEIFF